MIFYFNHLIYQLIPTCDIMLDKINVLKGYTAYFKNYYTSCFVLSHQTFTNETTRCHTSFEID